MERSVPLPRLGTDRAPGGVQSRWKNTRGATRASGLPLDALTFGGKGLRRCFVGGEVRAFPFADDSRVRQPGAASPYGGTG